MTSIFNPVKSSTMVNAVATFQFTTFADDQVSYVPVTEPCNHHRFWNLGWNALLSWIGRFTSRQRMCEFNSVFWDRHPESCVDEGGNSFAVIFVFFFTRRPRNRRFCQRPYCSLSLAITRVRRFSSRTASRVFRMSLFSGRSDCSLSVPSCLNSRVSMRASNSAT